MTEIPADIMKAARETSRSAAKAYREAIRLIWSYPEPQWEADQERAFWARKMMEEVEKE